MYKLHNQNTILRLSDFALIPQDETNSDYKDYLAWIAEGNTPLPGDVPTLTELKLSKVAYINQKASAELAQITSAYPKDEVATWPNQLEDAKAWQVDPLATLSILPQIALAAGITVDELAVRVLALAAQFNNISGVIIGKRKLKTKQVELALTNEEVELVIW